MNALLVLWFVNHEDRSIWYKMSRRYNNCIPWTVAWAWLDYFFLKFIKISLIQSQLIRINLNILLGVNPCINLVSGKKPKPTHHIEQLQIYQRKTCWTCIRRSFSLKKNCPCLHVTCTISFPLKKKTKKKKRAVFFFRFWLWWLKDVG